MPRAQHGLAEVLAAAETPSGAVRVGVLVDLAGGAPRVEFRGSGGPVRARSMIPLDAAALAGGRREVVLLLEGGDVARPIVAGFLEPAVATPALDAALGLAGEEAVATVEPPDVAEVDGRRVVLEGRDEIVLRCGEASITLRRNGKVVIRGLHVETHAAGTNRLKGATVKIN